MSNFYKEETKSIQKMNSSDEDESKSADEAAEVKQPIATDAGESSVSSEDEQEENSSVQDESKTVEEAAEVQQPIATDAEDPFVSSEEMQEEDRTVSIFCCKSHSLEGSHEAETRPDK